MNTNNLIENYLTENGFENLKDYEGKYMINREGKIWSIKSKKELSSTLGKGHLRIGLMTNGKQKQYRIEELLDIQYNGKINEHIHHVDLTEFEDLKDFEGLYKINIMGLLWSCIYTKIMKPTMSDDGYLKINLKANGVKFKKSIHRLLAIQYIPNPNDLSEIDHIDRIKLNNNLENLRWVDDYTNSRNRDCVINRQGSVYQDRRGDKIYWKASISINRKVKQKTSINEEVCREWLEEMLKQYPTNEEV
jgi:hypothetical protein